MNKICLLFAVVFILCSCGGNIDTPIDEFNAKAVISISDSVFISEINEQRIMIQGENFASPIIFSDNTILCDDLTFELIPEKNSAFLLPELVLKILQDRKTSGTYNDIEYCCEFKNDATLSEVRWGDVFVVFDYFK